jgi:hypothetical protein
MHLPPPLFPLQRQVQRQGQAPSFSCGVVDVTETFSIILVSKISGALLVTVVMMRGVSPYFNKLRKAVGSLYLEGGKRQTALEPAPAAEIDALLHSAHFMGMTVVGLGILAVIVFLMMFKPF